MECPVCWESMGSVGKATVSVPCGKPLTPLRQVAADGLSVLGHLFHDECLTQALQPMAPECPMCRSPIHDCASLRLPFIPAVC